MQRVNVWLKQNMHFYLQVLWPSVSFKGSVTFTVTGSIDPTKLTHVTAALSVFAPSTDMVNMGGGEQ